MRRTRLVALATASLISAAVTLPLSSTQAGAVTGSAAGAAPSSSGNAAPSDSLTPKWRAKFEERNQKALEKRLRQGGRGTSVKVGKHAYGRVAQTGQDKIFVVLAEFGNTQHSAYAGQSPRARSRSLRSRAGVSTHTAVDANGRSAADPAPHPSRTTIGAQGVSCHSANRSAVQS